MLNQLFSTSRPAGYIVIAVFLLFAYSLNLFSDVTWMADPTEVLKKIILFFVMVLSVLLVQFISVKNQLNSNSLYSLFFYSCFLLLFSSYFENSKIIMANFFVLLGLRRLFSMHSMITPKQKLFDASLWFLMAAVFNSWTILFLAMVYLTVIWYVSEDYRNWIIPIIASAVVAVLFYTYGLATDFDFIEYWKEKFVLSLNFQYFENNFQRIALSIFAALCCLFISYQATLMKKAPMHQHNLYKSILMCFIIGASIYVLCSPKQNACLVYTFFPLSIAAGNFVLNVEQKWIKETVMVAVLIISVFVFAMQL